MYTDMVSKFFLHGHEDRRIQSRVHSRSSRIRLDVNDAQQGCGNVAHDDVLRYVAVNIQIAEC